MGIFAVTDEMNLAAKLNCPENGESFVLNFFSLYNKANFKLSGKKIVDTRVHNLTGRGEGT